MAEYVTVMRKDNGEEYCIYGWSKFWKETLSALWGKSWFFILRFILRFILLLILLLILLWFPMFVLFLWLRLSPCRLPWLLDRIALHPSATLTHIIHILLPIPTTTMLPAKSLRQFTQPVLELFNLFHLLTLPIL